MGSEQRKNIRFLVKDNIKDNIIAMLRNGSTKIVKLKDISLGGLSFEHIYDENLDSDSIKKDIFLLLKGICIFKVPFVIVYDIPVRLPEEDQRFAIRFISRRCGVKFQTLLEEQAAQLDSFIRSHTIRTEPC